MRLLYTAIVLTFLTPIAASADTNSTAARALYEQGVADNEAGLLIAATVAFTNALAIDPDFQEAYYQRGLAFAGMGETQHATQDFVAAVDGGIQVLDAYFRLLATYKAREDYAAAIAVTDQLAAHMPENAAGAFWDKGQIYELMGDKPNAIAAFEACIARLDSDNSDFADTVRARIAVLR